MCARVALVQPPGWGPFESTVRPGYVKLMATGPGRCHQPSAIFQPFDFLSSRRRSRRRREEKRRRSSASPSPLQEKNGLGRGHIYTFENWDAVFYVVLRVLVVLEAVLCSATTAILVQRGTGLRGLGWGPYRWGSQGFGARTHVYVYSS